MKVLINQQITNILDENRNIITSKMLEVFLLIPDEGKELVEISSGHRIKGKISVNSKAKISNYTEIDK